MADQQSRSFIDTTEAMRCPYSIMIKTVACTSHNKKDIKREKKKTESESLNFTLTLIFEDSDLGGYNSKADFDQQY